MSRTHYPPRRIQLGRTKGWRKPENTVVVARPSVFGNPWKPGEPGGFWLPDYMVENPVIGYRLDAEDAVGLYRCLLTQGPDLLDRHLPEHLTSLGRRIVRNDLRSHATTILARLLDLRGKNLACWCRLDQPCHADVLLELANAEGRDG